VLSHPLFRFLLLLLTLIYLCGLEQVHKLHQQSPLLCHDTVLYMKQHAAVYRVRLYSQYFLTCPPPNPFNNQPNHMYLPSTWVVKQMVMCQGIRPSPSQVRMNVCVLLTPPVAQSVFLQSTLFLCFVVSFPSSSILYMECAGISSYDCHGICFIEYNICM